MHRVCPYHLAARRRARLSQPWKSASAWNARRARAAQAFHCLAAVEWWSGACKCAGMSPMRSTVNARDPNDCWGLVLAGGRGRRLQRITAALHEPSEKQFCRLGSERTLLQQSVERLVPLVRGTTVVVRRDRRRLAAEQLAERPNLSLVDQPWDRGTGIGTLIGLLDVRDHAPDAVVVLSPADHAFTDEVALRATLGEVVATARAEDAVVLVGAAPDAPRCDYGWIVPEAPASGTPRVRCFMEKPPEEMARTLMGDGGLFNTMILAAPVPVLMRCFEQVCPEAIEVLSSPEGRRALALSSFDDTGLPTVGPFDFSRDILGAAGDLRVQRLPRAAGWTDLGDECRLACWLEAQGRVEVANQVRRASRPPPVPSPREAVQQVEQAG